MKFYVKTIQQVHTENGKLGEYSTKSDPLSEKEATTQFYNSCADVNADLSDKGHTFMDIKIENSEGGVVKRDTLGKYVEVTE